MQQTTTINVRIVVDGGASKREPGNGGLVHKVGLARPSDGDTVRDMPVDEFDSTAVTAELPPVEAGRVGGDPGVISGRARPVVLSEMEHVLIGKADDSSVHREWLRATDRGDVDGDRPWRRSLASLIAHGAVVIILAIPAMLIVVFGLAVATR